MSLKTIRSFSSSFLILFPVLVTARDFIGIPSEIKGKSMQPTFNPGRKRKKSWLEGWNDYVWVKTWDKYELRENVQPGMVVALVSPRDPCETLVKRVVAVAGERICKKHWDECVTVPQLHVWVEGDNEKVSEDSNKFGPVSIALIEGEVTHILWPWSRWQRVIKEVTLNQMRRIYVGQLDDILLKLPRK